MSGNQGLPNFPTKTKREPKVIVFEEPMSRRNRNKNGSSDTKRKRKLDPNNEDRVDIDFVDIAREVKEFGMTGFSKKEQRKNMQRYAEHLGAHKKKAEKVPYPILMERMKARKVKEGRQHKLEEAMGIFKKKRKEDKTNLAVKHNLGRWVDKSRVDGLGNTGRKESLRRVTKHDVRKIQNMKI